MHEYISIHTYTSTYTHTYICMYVSMHMNILVSLCMHKHFQFMSLSLSSCIHIHIIYTNKSNPFPQKCIQHSTHNSTQTQACTSTPTHKHQKYSILYIRIINQNLFNLITYNVYYSVATNFPTVWTL